jgi:hypothetical protein
MTDLLQVYMDDGTLCEVCAHVIDGNTPGHRRKCSICREVDKPKTTEKPAENKDKKT